MLGPSFKEGKQLSEQGTLDLPLPDDNGEDMAIICDILPSPQQLVQTPRGQKARGHIYSRRQVQLRTGVGTDRRALGQGTQRGL